MSEAKTRPASENVADFLARIEDPQRRGDCQQLVAMMEHATGSKAVMWGSSIVGFGRYLQTYANGSKAEWMVIGFSPRKNDLTLYLMPGFEAFPELMAQLGKHKTGKACLYLKKLADVNLEILELLIAAAVAGMAERRIC